MTHAASSVEPAKNTKLLFTIVRDNRNEMITYVDAHLLTRCTVIRIYCEVRVNYSQNSECLCISCSWSKLLPAMHLRFR